MIDRRQALAHGSAALACLLLPGLPRAQARLTTLYVSGAPGAALDTVARRLAEGLREPLAGTVIVENKPGVGGQLALVALKQAAADGHAFALMPPSPFTIFPSTFARLPYDANADFMPLGTACHFDFAVAVAAQHPARTLDEFAEWCRRHPSQSNFALFGLGSAMHFLGWTIARKYGIALEPVPYTGVAQIAQQMLGGQVASAIASTANFAELHRSGKMRILATSGAHRSAQLEGVPSFGELGLGAIQLEEWYGWFVRSATPPAEQQRLAAAVRAVQAQPEVRKAIEALGFTPGRFDGPQLAQAIKADQARWAEVVKQTGFKAQG